MLGKYGASPKVLRIGDATPRGYTRETLTDLWNRYLPQVTATPATSATPLASHVADVADVADTPPGDRQGGLPDAALAVLQHKFGNVSLLTEG